MKPVFATRHPRDKPFFPQSPNMNQAKHILTDAPVHLTNLSRRRFFAALAAAFPAVTILNAQEPLKIDKDATFSTDVKLVNIFATVHDKKNAIVKDLAKDDFTLDEDGKAQTIKHFSRESDLALTLGLLVDT